MAKNKAAVLSVLNITWRLLVICLAVAALVALVFEITEEPIAEGERSRKEEAIRVIFADAHSAEEAKGIESERINAVYSVKNEKGELIKNPAYLDKAQGETLSGYYAIEKLQPYDMFPQTKAIECLVCITRKE